MMATNIRSKVSALIFVTAVSISAQAKNGFYATHFPWDTSSVNFVMGPQGLQAAPAPAPGNLIYYGGPVISNVKAYAVFWGPNVNADVQQKIGGYYKAMSNSSYLDWLDEYSTFGQAVDGRAGTKQHIGRGAFVKSVMITPIDVRTEIDDVDIQAELKKQISAGVLPKPDTNSLFMLYFPPGMTITASGMKSCSAFCAYHGFSGTPETEHFYYGVMPDIGGACSFGCSASSTPFDSMTAISAHEFIEAITDPFPTPGSNPAYPQAWNTVDGSEIGDMCATSGNSILAAGAVNYVVQSEWDNSKNACTVSDWVSN